jgi:hypothetical protein
VEKNDGVAVVVLRLDVPGEEGCAVEGFNLNVGEMRLESGDDLEHVAFGARRERAMVGVQSAISEEHGGGKANRGISREEPSKQAKRSAHPGGGYAGKVLIVQWSSILKISWQGRKSRFLESAFRFGERIEMLRSE